MQFYPHSGGICSVMVPVHSKTVLSHEMPYSEGGDYCHQRSILENRSQNERTVSSALEMPICLSKTSGETPIAISSILTSTPYEQQES